MKPVHVVVLLLAGALGGALLMKVIHPAQAIRAAVVAQVQPAPAAPPEQKPAQTPAAEPKPTPAPAVTEPQKPSPMQPPVRQVARSEGPQPRPVRAVASMASDSVPARHAINLPLPVSPSAPVSPPATDPGPAFSPMSPTITPPLASPEPEHMTPVRPQVPVEVPADVSAAPAPQPHQVTLNAGFLLPVRLVDGLSSERNAPGDVFQATLDRELVAEGFVIAERGARVEGRVVAVDRAKVGSAALAVELTRLHTSDGQTVPIQTENYFKHANPGQVNKATKVAGGAIIGAAIGAIAGGGKGAAIGAGIGGGAGAGDVLLTRKPAELPSETLVTFKLKSTVPLTEKVQ